MIIFGKNEMLLDKWMQHFDCFEIELDDKLYAVNIVLQVITAHPTRKYVQKRGII